MVASDTLHENNTIIRIRVKDVNDLPPKFERSSYETTILEEEKNGLPKKIIKVDDLLPECCLIASAPFPEFTLGIVLTKLYIIRLPPLMVIEIALRPLSTS